MFRRNLGDGQLLGDGESQCDTPRSCAGDFFGSDLYSAHIQDGEKLNQNGIEVSNALLSSQIEYLLKKLTIRSDFSWFRALNTLKGFLQLWPPCVKYLLSVRLLTVPFILKRAIDAPNNMIGSFSVSVYVMELSKRGTDIGRTNLEPIRNHS